MLIAHRIALDLNNQQATYLKKACWVARFAYNWALPSGSGSMRNGKRITPFLSQQKQCYVRPGVPELLCWSRSLSAVSQERRV
jgi:hypothetical protein